MLHYMSGWKKLIWLIACDPKIFPKFKILTPPPPLRLYSTFLALLFGHLNILDQDFSFSIAI